MAQVARFYGWTHDYIRSLEAEVFDQYFKAIEVIRANETLIQLKVSDFPQLDGKQRSKVHAQFSKRANPKEFREEEVLKTGDLFKKMKGMGF